MDVANSPGEYTVEAQVLDLTNQDRISGNRLAAASTAYPKEITDLYTQIPDQAIGPDAQLLLDTIKGLADTDNPYELAKFMETYLHGKQFVYSIDLRDQPCDSPSAVECFARTKHGLLPALRLDDGDPAARGEPREPHPDEGRRGVPPGGAGQRRGQRDQPRRPRLGRGLLPGLRLDPVRSHRRQHRPVESDPSGAERLARSGRRVPRDLPDPTRPLQAGDGRVPPAPPGSGGQNPIANRGLLVVLTVLLFAVVASIAFAAWLRGPRGEITPDRAWQSMAKAAGRFGFGPRPNQTVYEYASTLGELVPVAKTDLSTIAEAKVETSYARVRLGGDRLNEVGNATRRVRVSLLRLLFRRRGRGRRRR